MNISHEQLNKILEEMVQNKLNHIEYTVDKILNLLEDRERGQESIEATKNTKKVVNTSFDQKHLDIANEIYRIINATVKTKQPYMSLWANEIRKIDVIDKIPINNIMKVFKAANKDDFWSMNIRSPQKLRKHWDRLYMMSLQTTGLNQKTDNREPLDYYREKNWK